MIDEQDPEGLFKDFKPNNACEDCGKIIKIDFKKCYDCYQKSK
ncbi:MAG: hypothetical protein AABX29_07730 [Nanoarchaeota archaeon]